MFSIQRRLLYSQSFSSQIFQHAHHLCLPKRMLSGRRQEEPSQTILQAKTNFRRATSDIRKKLKGLSFEKLNSLVPTQQEELAPRTMKESWDSAIIPIGSDIQLRRNYSSLNGGVRIGRLLEDMDFFAAIISFQYSLNEKDGLPIPIVHVTAVVDHIDFMNNVELKIDQDMKLEGYVSWVGRSSAQIVINVLQRNEDKWLKVMRAVFSNVARNPQKNVSAVINPLTCETEEEKKLFQEGERRMHERSLWRKKALFIAPPNEQEKELVHDLLMKMADPIQHSYSLKNMPKNSAWMKDSKLKNVLLCFLENRNPFGKIFGGFLMREAFELAYANAAVYSGQIPNIIHIDDIQFRIPVDTGAMLFLSSQVVFTENCHVQVSTKASVYDVTQKKRNMTNIFHFTFEVPEPAPICLPHSYQEAMMYIDGRRRFQQVQDRKLGQ